MNNQIRYINQKRSQKGTPAVYRKYTQGSQRQVQKRARNKNKPTLQRELKNTHNASYKRIIHIMDQTSPRTKEPNKIGLQSSVREAIIFKHYSTPLLPDCPHQTKKHRPPQLGLLLPPRETSHPKIKSLTKKGQTQPPPVKLKRVVLMHQIFKQWISKCSIASLASLQRGHLLVKENPLFWS